MVVAAIGQGWTLLRRCYLRMRGGLCQRTSRCKHFAPLCSTCTEDVTGSLLAQAKGGLPREAAAVAVQAVAGGPAVAS